MSADRAERLARVALNVLGEPGDPRIARLVVGLGAQDVYDRLLADPALDGLRSETSARLGGLDPAGVLDRADRAGIRFVVPGDQEWPEQVMGLDTVEPLSGMAGAPLGLWVRGPAHLADTLRGSVAVVGSRSFTTYGDQVARDLAAGLCASGRTVVSGAAFGIDQAAHRAVLGSNGTTVAVLAGGVDRAYPAAHADLLTHIRETGAVVSELQPGCSPTRSRFLARNRLIAAMSTGTVVVEAALRSGALNTAAWAQRLQRVVMGVPGPVTSAPSEGVHELLRRGEAGLVTRPEHVEDLVGPIGRSAWVPPRAPETLFDLLPDADRRVLEAVPLARAAPVTSIARTAGVSVSAAGDALLRLGEDGWVVCGGEDPARPLWRQVRAGAQPLRVVGADAPRNGAGPGVAR